MTLVSSTPSNSASQQPTLRSSTPRTTAPRTAAPAARVSTARPRTRDGLARPKTGEVRVRIGALGLSSLGIQAAGLVSAVGPDAGGFAAGDRVSYRTDMPVGETSPYSTGGLSTVVPERELIGFPKDVSLEAAAAYLPLGLVARTIVKQLHSVGRGNRVAIADDETGAAAFVEAWVLDLGAEVVDHGDKADVVITPADFVAAHRWRYANGLGQIAAADVFAEVRRGIFDHIPVTNYPIADADRARDELEKRVASSPIVLLPAAA